MPETATAATEPPIRTVLIVGSGVMGMGICRSFAAAGFDCLVMSRNPAGLKDLPSGVRAVAEPPKEAPDLVIESIPEEMALKLDLFRRLDALYGGRAALASNTSGLPLQEIADALEHPRSFCGIHYFQPAEAFEFVEFAEVKETAPDVTARVKAALERTGKQVIHVRKPVVGLVINRLQHALAHEAYYMIGEGIADAETIDLVLKNLLGPRLAVTGHCEQKDIAGIGMHAQTQRAIVPHLHHGAEPNPLLQRMVEEGRLGIRSGRGFYDWEGRDIEAFKKKAADKLARILAIAKE